MVEIGMIEIKISLAKLIYILREASAVCSRGKYLGRHPARQSERAARGGLHDGSMWHCNNMARYQAHAGKLLFFCRRLARPCLGTQRRRGRHAIFHRRRERPGSPLCITALVTTNTILLVDSEEIDMN
ncbi:hypothetical protein [Janthinobacterium sp. PSPC3-1]|uniref:hypothetical protein n=1 Tax=Janthinobacterium sp. PSPC3-1 TaxID=2804653 RepID=UPI003CF936C0